MLAAKLGTISEQPCHEFQKASAVAIISKFDAIHGGGAQANFLRQLAHADAVGIAIICQDLPDVQDRLLFYLRRFRRRHLIVAPEINAVSVFGVTHVRHTSVQ